MRILQINVTLNSGSTGRIAESLGQKVQANGWESYFAYGRRRNLSKSHPIRIGSFLSVAYHGIITRLFDMHGLGARLETAKFIRKIKKIKPDLIHLHNIHGYYINIKILFRYLKEYDGPVVITLHDCWLFTGHCTYFSHVDCNKWKDVCNNCPLIQDYPSSLFLDRSEKNFMLKKSLFSSINNLTVVTVSNWLRELTKDSILKNLPTEVIYNGIDLEIFRPYSVDVKKKYGIKGGKYILGVAHKWSRRKGLQDIINLRKILDPEIKIVLVGGRLNPKLNIPGKIKCINKTENTQMLAELYSGAEAFVNPSIMETFGLTTAEAIACGTPVVVYNCTAMPEIINSNVGYVVEKHDIDKLNSSIMKIISEGKDKYSDKCRAYAEKHFDMKIQNDKYMSLYKDLLKIKE